jgi:acetyl esterase/lipase
MMTNGSLFSYLCKTAGPPFPSEFCPVAWVDSSFPPTFIMNAGGDKLVPTSQSFDFYEVLKSRGVECAMATAVDMEHGKSENWDETDVGYEKWWEEAIEPGLRWMVDKTRS